jgi:sulfonate transport system substrate-binding protein
MRFESLVKIVVVGVVLVAAQHRAAAAAAQQVRIGLVKIGAILVLKQQGTLAKLLADRGVILEWKEFETGAAMLAAIGAGAVDFGRVGDTGPIFAQASNTEFHYVAYEPSPGTNSAILVPSNSPIQTLADIRDKRIAVARGSNCHNFLAQAVEKVGLNWTDIKSIYLSPADAGAAFTGGSVDAWAIWDPIYANAQVKFKARVLTDAVGIAPSSDFYLGSRSFVAEHPDLLKLVIGELIKASMWAKSHPDELAPILTAATGVSLEAEKLSVLRDNYDVDYMADSAVVLQQSIADRMLRLNLIPKAVQVKELVWKPSP